MNVLGERREQEGRVWGGGGARTAASDISASRLTWGRVWLGGSIGSGGGRSGIEWILSIGGIGVDASEASGSGFAVSSAIFSLGMRRVWGAVYRLSC